MPVSYTHLKSNSFDFSITSLIVINSDTVGTIPPVSYTHLFLISCEITLSAFTGATANDVSVGGTSRSLNEPLIESLPPVSYTHLDVYKRQVHYRATRPYRAKVPKFLQVQRMLSALYLQAFDVQTCLLYTSRCV